MRNKGKPLKLRYEVQGLITLDPYSKRPLCDLEDFDVLFTWDEAGAVLSLNSKDTDVAYTIPLDRIVSALDRIL